MVHSRILGGALVALGMLFPVSAWSTEVVQGDFQTILNSKSASLVVWNYAPNPDIYIIDYPNLTQQGLAFNRMTQLIEQYDAPYKRVLSAAEIEKYMEAIRRNQANFAFGHDFLVSEMVLFFNLADRDKIELFPEEIAVRDFLIEMGLMKLWRGFYQAIKPDAVLLSIPQTQPKHDGEPKITDLAREAIFMHEIAHGEFYANPYYADYCRKFWSNTLNEAQRGVWQRFLSKYNYSVNQQELIVNEMQAYLMFTPDPNSISAAKLGITDDELKAMRVAFASGRPPTRLLSYTGDIK